MLYKSLKKNLTWKPDYEIRLSHILDIPSISVFPIWYTRYIISYTRYIISNVTFTFWSPVITITKCVMLGILHEKHGSTKKLADSKFPCYLTEKMNSSILECLIRAVCSYFILKLSGFCSFVMELANRLAKG